MIPVNLLLEAILRLPNPKYFHNDEYRVPLIHAKPLSPRFFSHPEEETTEVLEFRFRKMNNEWAFVEMKKQGDDPMFNFKGLE